MRHSIQLLWVLLLILSSAANASPVSYSYFGTIIQVFDQENVNIGDRISVVVTYDPSLPPVGFATVPSSGGESSGYMTVANGPANGLPFTPWLHITATYGPYTWSNLIESLWSNGETVGRIVDGLPGLNPPGCGPSCPHHVMDSYEPFSVGQCVEAICEQARIYDWSASADRTSNPNLTNGLAFPQPIDLANATSNQGFVGTLPTRGRPPLPQGVSFTFDQINGPVAVPEPGTVTMIAAGFTLLYAFRRRRSNPAIMPRQGVQYRDSPHRGGAS